MRTSQLLVCGVLLLGDRLVVLAAPTSDRPFLHESHCTPSLSLAGFIRARAPQGESPTVKRHLQLRNGQLMAALPSPAGQA